ncbi:hypothetical protein ACIOKD_30265 [Streptomyces sp. NPDC087844]|uniref:hypothetical protein n=1 Tax=Streptomyces sp. NPDC087844 TaxID=3365805 RepID=UPI0037F3D86B
MATRIEGLLPHTIEIESSERYWKFSELAEPRFVPPGELTSTSAISEVARRESRYAVERGVLEVFGSRTATVDAFGESYPP